MSANPKNLIKIQLKFSESLCDISFTLFCSFFPRKFQLILVYIYIYNFFLFVGLISVICWFLHCRRESDQALWHFYWVWVFDSLTWGVEMGVAVQHLPQIIQWLAQVAIHFSTLTSGFRCFFCAPQPWGGNTVEKRVAVTWGFPYSFAGCSLSSCSFRYLSGTLFQFAFNESQNAAAWAQTKAMQKNKGEKSPSHFCIHPHFFRPLSPSSCVLFAQLGSNYG